MLPTALLLTLPLAAAAEPEAKGYVLDTHESKHVEATLHFSVRQDGIKVEEWVLFVPQAPELPSQTKVHTKSDPKGEPVVVTQGELKRAVLRARVPAKTADWQKGYDMNLTIEATLMARKLRPLGADETPPKLADLPERERKAALASVGDINHEAPLFREWLKDHKLTRDKGEGEIEFARRVFLAVRQFKYEVRGEMDRSALAVCKAGKSDCGGLSAWFCAALRAEGIPARMLMGRWASSSPPDGSHNSTHAKAEFFAKGVGWVPADLAAGLVYDRSKEGLKYFGDDPGDFVTFHVDDHFELNTILHGKKVMHNLQSPASWATGKGEPGNPKYKDEWKVREVK